jgi:predicted metal-dependent hydrolase
VTIRRRQIEVRGIQVEVVRKDIKNLHLGVYPPNGRVRVAAPLRVNDEAVRLAVISRLGWIRRQQDGFDRQDRQSLREMVTGESHYVQGRRYRLDVIEQDGPASVRLSNTRTLELRVRPKVSRDQREAVLHRWYRQRLRQRIPQLIAQWEPAIGVSVAEWGIKRMKTRWGTCNSAARRIWLNLELAKKPASCLEYILVHEMVHLLERHHNERFRELMDRLMPLWREYREVLNHAPLAHESWSY